MGVAEDDGIEAVHFGSDVEHHVLGRLGARRVVAFQATQTGVHRGDDQIRMLVPAQGS